MTFRYQVLPEVPVPNHGLHGHFGERDHSKIVTTPR